MSEGRIGAGTAAAPVDFELANRLFFRLYQCSNLLHKNGTRHVSDAGATTQQWAVIGALVRPLVRERGMAVKEMIDFLLLSRQNLTQVLDRLEERGWVERVRDPEDGRGRLIRMTPTGKAAWEGMQDGIRTFYGNSLSALSQAERLQLAQLLDRLKSGLETA